jgi:hypothetical protein
MSITEAEARAIFEEYGQDEELSLIPSVLPSLLQAFTEWANDYAYGDAESAYDDAFVDGCYRGEFASDAAYAESVLDAYDVPLDLASWLTARGIPEFVAQAMSVDYSDLVLIMKNTEGLNFNSYGLHVFTEAP